jgi:FKBP-type peptidyl-prolyl cis-trans isomerase
MTAYPSAIVRLSRWFAGAAACLVLAGAAQAVGAATPDKAPAENPAAKWDQKDRVSYSVGAQTGRALRTADGAEVNLDALVRGLKDGLDGSRLLIPEKEMQALLQGFQQMLRQKMAASHGRAVAENRKKAMEFFAENKKKPGMVSLSSGVQYQILKSGTGPLPKEEDVALVSYRGTLLNGTEFDSTEPGHPTRLKISGLIAGWKEALKLMPVGSHWKLYIPPQMAYGERGVGSDIGPNEALVFDVELLGTQLGKDD